MLKDIYGKAHFIGIGGISLSSLALYLKENGIEVSGSDRSFSVKLTYLNEKGCDVWVGSHPEKIENPDIVIFSSAVRSNDPELEFCRKKGFFCTERNEFLRLLCDDFSCCVAVAGTHGKTTVTAMLISVFRSAGKRFFGHVGGETKEYGNFSFTGNDYLLTEACEYKKSFLFLKPKIGIILNAEADHPDTYKNLGEVYDAFDEFCAITEKNSGLVLVNGDCEYYKKRLASSNATTYGISKSCRFEATDIYEYKNGYKGFLICDYGNPIGHIRLSVPGNHNVCNALCAFVAAYLIGIPTDIVCTALSSFVGVKRRFEYVCKYLGCDVYSDYAHHPDEIRAVVDTALSLKKGALTVVFQPHTYSRTAELFDGFKNSFSDVKRLIILKEYAARETPDEGKSAKELFDAIEHGEKYYCDNIIDAAILIEEKILPEEILLVLGAGDVVNLCDILKQ